MQEEWKGIPGCKKAYMLSSHGRVWDARNRRYLNPSMGKTGYAFYQIRQAGAMTSRGACKLMRRVWPEVSERYAYDRDWAASVRSMNNASASPGCELDTISDRLAGITYTPGCAGVNDINFNPLG